MRSLYNLSDLGLDEIFRILDEAEAFKNGAVYEGAKGKLVANLFFEPSTRTHYSFEAAQHRLGCCVMSFAPESSSLKKGESFYDTVRTMESFGTDALVIRATQNEYYKELKPIKIPILNAGDGTGNHPTQSLLDLLTIRQEFGRFEGLKIAIAGDIKHSRVAHTNIGIMERLGMDVYVSGPEMYAEEGHKFVSIDDAAKDMDVIMLLRVQHERHKEGAKALTAEEYNTGYGLNANRVAKMKEKAIIMHPAPFNRGVELTDDVVECEKSRIFKQVTNGVYVRMAVLKRAFGGF